jgi:hypothetical protein
MHLKAKRPKKDLPTMKSPFSSFKAFPADTTGMDTEWRICTDTRFEAASIVHILFAHRLKAGEVESKQSGVGTMVV